MRSQVMERPRAEARHRMMRKRAMLGIIRIAALLERQAELNLSDDQLKQLLGIRSDLIRMKAKLNGEIRVARLDLIYTIAANIGNVNSDQVRSALKNIYALRMEKKVASIDAFRKAADVLSGEQKDMFKNIVRENLSEYEAADVLDFTEEEE